MTATATRIRPVSGLKQPAPGVSVIGENIEAAVDGNVLTIRIDLSKRLRDSGSGKTVIVATSGGNQPIEGGGGVVLGLNAYVKK